MPQIAHFCTKYLMFWVHMCARCVRMEKYEKRHCAVHTHSKDTERGTWVRRTLKGRQLTLALLASQQDIVIRHSCLCVWSTCALFTTCLHFAGAYETAVQVKIRALHCKCTEYRYANGKYAIWETVLEYRFSKTRLLWIYLKSLSNLTRQKKKEKKSPNSLET